MNPIHKTTKQTNVLNSIFADFNNIFSEVLPKEKAKFKRGIREKVREEKRKS